MINMRTTVVQVGLAAGITDMHLNARATTETDIAGRLAYIAQHASDVRYSVLLGMVEVFWRGWCRP